MEKVSEKTGGSQTIRIPGDIPAPSGGKFRQWVRENLLLVLTVLGVFSGSAIGLLARQTEYSDEVVLLVGFPGELLLRSLKMLILPLIISSLVSGLACLDAGASGKMGSRALLYYFSTTIMAAILGITVVVVIHPGDPSSSGSQQEQNASGDSGDGDNTVMDALLDIIRNMFPDNLITACFQSVKTEAKLVNKTIGEGADQRQVTKVQRDLVVSEGTNVMGLIIFCVGFGLIAGQMGPQGKLMVDFFLILNEITMKMVCIIMWYSPFGICCLVAGNLMAIDNLADTARSLGMYMATVVTGLLIHATVSLPMVYFCVTRKNPFKFCKGIVQAWALALGTASSSAALPITFQCLEVNNGLDKRVTRFVLPVGATVNMDGTALYEAVASIFIAQKNNMNLSIGGLITVSLTATLASIGAASIPSAALVTMLLILQALGLPTHDVALIFTVDWLLDRMRTSINVLGDAYGAGIVQHLCRDELARMDAEAERRDREMAEMLRSGSVALSGGGRGSLLPRGSICPSVAPSGAMLPLRPTGALSPAEDRPPPSAPAAAAARNSWFEKRIPNSETQI
ncbi:excitatory amino acid transporter-like [Amphibalanus amphitrite]|nr:excitatory amino acid transporter-like [Amphibalanus amphitrite]